MRFRALLVPVAAIGLLAACGDNAPSASSTPSTTAVSGPTTTVAGALPKPQVKIPATSPTELVITDLTKGTGPAAADGDTVIVHYVGVRSADGTEFDNNYDSGASLSVTLGVGQVIKGWDQGLIGVQPGGRRQLDIPTALAYGDSPQGTIIQKGDALSFVIDVVTVIPKPDPASAPNITIPPTPNQPTQTFTDLIVGTGAAIQPGQTVALQLLAFSAADGKQIDSSWASGTPLTFIPGAGQLPPGLEKAVDGMKVGGRRQVVIPFADAFGAAGNTSLGLPPSTDLIMVLDLVAVY
jgi:peptidylprolyl isomerase